MKLVWLVLIVVLMILIKPPKSNQLNRADHLFGNKFRQNESLAWEQSGT